MSRRQPATGRDPGEAGSSDPLFVRAVLSLYPPQWQERYGEEFACLLSDMAAVSSWAARVWLIANAVGGALGARLHPPGGRAMPERIRGHITAAACAAMAFAITIAGLGKIREDPAFGNAGHAHAAVAASAGILRGAAVAAGVTVLAAALPLAWTVISQAVTTRRKDLIRPLAAGPAAVAGWLAVAWITRQVSGHASPRSGPNLAAAAAFTLLGAAAAVAAAGAAAALLRRADLAPRLLRAEVLPMAVLSVCMALATGSDISWGMSIQATDGALFRSGSAGLVATPFAPNWAGSAMVLAAVTAVTAAATVRAARHLRTGPASCQGTTSPGL